MGAPYVVSEPVDGHDLETHLRLYGPLSAEEVVLLAIPSVGRSNSCATEA